MLKPLSSNRWNYEMAAHLLNRAGFGGPPTDIEKLAALDHDQAISFLLDYENIYDPTPNPVWADPDPQRLENLRAAIAAATPADKKLLQQQENKLQADRMLELRGWWFNRMAKTPRPFLEKMVLFWHGHFATSIDKVRGTPNWSYLMWRQNELFRRLATDNWLRMLIYVAQDPAMLIYLDQALSRKEHPNENFAREVMELFSLGEGHYTEHDVTEAARALTGWSYDRLNQKFIDRPAFHDNGIKTVLGLTGNLDGYDFLAQIVKQPQSALFITAKIWNYFAGQYPSVELNNALAAVFRQGNDYFKPFLRVMFRSEEFYGDDIVRNEVKSPVDWLVGSTRMLESDLPPPFICNAITTSLGQALFEPPSVKGWDGGIAWITTNTLLARYNDAATLVQGTIQQLSAADFARKPGGAGGQKFEKLAQRIHIGGVDAEKILTPEERDDKDSIVASLQNRLFQTTLDTSQQKVLREFLDSKKQLNNEDILTTIRLMMSTPEYQVT
ncbi:MAG TPA: DUF1800 domain-containing protein [Candidatus Aquilonibacter sp.]|nr:DUF1800 domain-containing protein [Candidatus Aquilonibacter sp.]